METINFALYAAGVGIIFAFALWRFNQVPRVTPIEDRELPPVLATLREWVRLRQPPPPLVSPPPRANTTAFKYWLYRIAYSLIGVALYSGLYAILVQKPALRDQITAFLTDTSVLSDLPPEWLTNGIILAFLLMLASWIPPFRGMDASFRKYLYEKASIPAEQLKLQYALRAAPFSPDEQLVEKVRQELSADGFSVSDIILEPHPTTRTLWTKISVLVELLNKWGTQDQYKTALSLIREPTSEKRSFDRVHEEYSALKSDARLCLEALHSAPDSEETVRREEQFRVDCHAFLDSLYALYSRVSLRSHHGYNQLVKAIRKLGFDIREPVNPIPDLNDLFWLVIILFFVTTIPLAFRVGLPSALTYTGVFVVATLIPVYIAAEWPLLLRPASSGATPIVFPVLTAALAGIIAAVVSVVHGAVCTGSECAVVIDLSAGVERLLERSWPWMLLIVGLTGALSVLMLVGHYPRPPQYSLMRAFLTWTSLRDAAVLSAVVLLVMLLVVVPHMIPDPWSWNNVGRVAGLVARPVATALVIGLIVPTWHRGNVVNVEVKQDDVS